MHQYRPLYIFGEYFEYWLARADMAAGRGNSLQLLQWYTPHTPMHCAITFLRKLTGRWWKIFNSSNCSQMVTYFEYWLARADLAAGRWNSLQLSRVCTPFFPLPFLYRAKQWLQRVHFVVNFFSSVTFSPRACCWALICVRDKRRSTQTSHSISHTFSLVNSDVLRTQCKRCLLFGCASSAFGQIEDSNPQRLHVTDLYVLLIFSFVRQCTEKQLCLCNDILLQPGQLKTSLFSGIADEFNAGVANPDKDWTWFLFCELFCVPTWFSSTQFASLLVANSIILAKRIFLCKKRCSFRESWKQGMCNQ